MRREILSVLWLGVLLVVLNGLVLQKEWLRSDGARVLLELRPRDPRSLMQGDYMVLRYRFAQSIERGDRPPTGTLVARLDEHRVARFARFDEGSALGPDEIRLRYQPSQLKGRRPDLRVAPESFFFQEGRAKDFDRARFAELRVEEDGSVMITGLLDASRQPIP